MIDEVLSGLGERISKEDLCLRIRDDFFKSYMIRLRLANIKIEKEPAQPVSSGPAQQQ